MVIRFLEKMVILDSAGKVGRKFSDNPKSISEPRSKAFITEILCGAS
jgi:hypothetical protein